MIYILSAAIVLLASAYPANARPEAAPALRNQNSPASKIPPLPARAERVQAQSAQPQDTTTDPQPQEQQRSQPAQPDVPARDDNFQAEPGTAPNPAASNGTAPNAGAPQNVPLPPHLPSSLAERAQTVLEKHCARCHQSGALHGQLVPDGGIANILSLDAIARNSALVRPGEPDSSPLYQQMIARQMPPDTANNGATGVPPEAAEIRAIRAWIKSLAAPIAGECPNRAPLTRDTIVTTVSRWLDAIGSDRAADTRFISLANIYTACASDAELAAYRQGIVAILNSLTWSPNPVAVETVGDTLAILAVRLSGLGWTKAQWDELANRYPPAARLDMPEAITRQTTTAVPLVSGDRLAHEVMKPELYNKLLGLPPELADLAGKLGIDLSAAREGRTVHRGIVPDSTITGGARIIERYPTARGALWMAHDFATADKTRILDHPLLPWPSANAKDERSQLPVTSGSRVLFALPNGMPAFMRFDAEGTSRSSPVVLAPAAHDAAPEQPTASNAEAKANGSQTSAIPPLPTHRPEIAANHGGTDNAAATTSSATANGNIRSGLSCVACHTLGPLGFEDHLADHLASDAYHGNPLERDAARNIVFSKPELENAIADEHNAVRRSLGAMGIDAAARIHGIDAITGLDVHYTRDLDVSAAAAELLMPVADLQKRLSDLRRTATPTAALATRLMLGRLSRDEFEVLRAALSSSQSAPSIQPEPTAPNFTPPSQPSLATSTGASQSAATPLAPGTLQLWPDKISYNRDDRIVLNVRAGRACYLTLINIDSAGHGTVLFPNEFTRDNLIKANEVKRLPAADALFYFRLQQAGTESFVAICEEGEQVPAGMRPDFTRMNFTELGDWETFLDASVKAAREPRVPLNNGDDIDRKRGKKQALRPAPATTPKQSRAAVTISIAP